MTPSSPLMFCGIRIERSSVICMCDFINGQALVCMLRTESLFQSCALGHIKTKQNTNLAFTVCEMF